MRRSLMTAAVCLIFLCGMLTGCGKSVVDKNGVWQDYSFYVNGTKIELPMLFAEFNAVLSAQGYTLLREKVFYEGQPGAGGVGMLSGGAADIYGYLNENNHNTQLQMTIKNVSEERMPNKDCMVVGISVTSAFSTPDTTVEFTSKKIVHSRRVTEQDLQKLFGEPDKERTGTDVYQVYRYGKFQEKTELVKYSLRVTVNQDGAISRIDLEAPTDVQD